MQMPRLVRGIASAALVVLLQSELAGAQETTRVSVDSAGAEGNGDCYYGLSISADGRFVAFESDASNLVAGDTNAVDDIFVHDRSTRLTERVSVDSAGAEGNGGNVEPRISADGQIVVFVSAASNLVAGDTNGHGDVFVHDRSTGFTERVCVDSSGAEGNDGSALPSISPDGRFVTFVSLASNLVAGDTNNNADIFVHDRITGLTERVSVDSSGAEGDGWSLFSAISADGQIVAFDSFATNLVGGDTNGAWDVFVHDRSTGLTERLSVDSSGTEGNDLSSYDFLSISTDGQIVAFQSNASNLVTGDTNGYVDVFVHDRSTGVTERVSVDSSGAEGNGQSVVPAISADGQIVAFVSDSSNLVAGDTNGFVLDVFVHNRSSGLTECVSVDSLGMSANWDSYLPSISADGQVVAFDSPASNLVAGDTNGTWDVFVHELCSIDATWFNYGAGFPGTNGVPSFTSQSDPVLGTKVTLDLGNSYGQSTVGLLLLGYAETLVPTNKGGDLLVVPAFTIVLTLDAAGAAIAGDIPLDDTLCGLELFAQALELDSGAANGMSFTEGLKLVLGH